MILFHGGEGEEEGEEGQSGQGVRLVTGWRPLKKTKVALADSNWL